MKHFFQLPFNSDKIVVVEYYITHVITKEFQDSYNAACMDKLKAEQDVDDALLHLQTAQPDSNALATAGHRSAVERMEAAAKLVEDLDQSPIPLQIRTDTITITIANLKGAQSFAGWWDVRCQLSFADLQQISREVQQLQERIAASTSPFRETLDY
jgi:hypothetical protein